MVDGRADAGEDDHVDVDENEHVDVDVNVNVDEHDHVDVNVNVYDHDHLVENVHVYDHDHVDVDEHEHVNVDENDHERAQPRSLQSPSMPLAAIAEVVLLNQSFDKPLSYLIPDALTGQVQIGCVVSVPLQNKLTSGVVIGLPDGAPAIDIPLARLKPIHTLVDPQPVLNAVQMDLARWIAREYFAPLGRCCALMVPPGFTPRSQYVYALAEGQGGPGALSSSPAATLRMRLVAVLQAYGPITETKLKQRIKAHGLRGWGKELKRLVDEGIATRTSTLDKPVAQTRKSTLAQLLISDTTLNIVRGNLQADAIKKPRQAPAIERRLAVLDYLKTRTGLAWAEWIYAETGATRNDLSWLADNDYVLLGDAQRWRDPLADVDYIVKTAPSLTEDQQRAWEAVRGALSAEREVWSVEREMTVAHRSTLHAPRQEHFLLRGVTGSGKTEIYMRAVDMVLTQGRSAIILVPEISLTPQTARRFLERFPGKVALIHSKLKPGERADTWRRIRSGELSVVVGARSGLFAPLPKLGLIVLDEEHDSSYKQGNLPYYDARRVALHYANLTGATLILGSATPSLESLALTRLTEDGGRRTAPTLASSFPHPASLKFLELPNRVRGHVNRVADQQARLGVTEIAPVKETETVLYQPLPPVQVIDMRAELRGGNTSMFSGALRLALGEVLQRREQAILFLNRRGSASCVMCRDCGHVLRCPNDDVPLTLHLEDGGRKTDDEKRSSVLRPPSSNLRCHQCNHTEPVPTICPTCRSSRIRFIGIGTQKVEQAIHELFPHARIVRWDKDASSKPGSADQLLQRFVNQQADVLIGTQMIAKGLDLPLVTLVGVVLADIGLFLPDFRSGERIFSLLEQVAGRAGRGLLPGRVIVQTYNPEQPAIQYAAKHDVQGFAKYELVQRQLLDLPPVTRLVRFETSNDNSDTARQRCEALARLLRARVPHVSDVIGPASAYFARRNNQYRWQILVRTHDPGSLLDGIEVPTGFIVDVDPASVL